MHHIFVSFPGLGIEPFELSPIAFTFGKLEVRWYGILIVTGIILAFLYAMWRGKKNENIIPDDVLDVGIVTVVLGVLGARAYYVATTWDSGIYDSFLDVIAIWEGGLGIYGGILCGILGILLACRAKRIRFLKLMDMAAPGVMLAQAVGRWGNFFNGEAYGALIGETSTLDLFGKTFVFSAGEGTFFHTFRMGLAPNVVSYYRMYDFHPTFLYESVWNLLGFVLVNIFYKHKKKDGQVALCYLGWYGLGRMFIEGLRTDSLYIPGTDLRISQCLGLCFFLACSIALLTSFLRKPRRDFMKVRETPEAPLFAPPVDPVERKKKAVERSEENDRFVERLLARFAERRAAALVNPPAPEEDEDEDEEEDNDVQAETKEETNVAPEATVSAADAAVSTEEQAPPTENDAETAAVEASPEDAADAPTLEEDAQEPGPTEEVQDQTNPETEEGERSNGTEN